MGFQHPVMRQHGEEVMRDVERLAIRENAGIEHGIHEEHPRIRELAIVRRVRVVRDFPELHQHRVKRQQGATQNRKKIGQA